MCTMGPSRVEKPVILPPDDPDRRESEQDPFCHLGSTWSAAVDMALFLLLDGAGRGDWSLEVDLRKTHGPTNRGQPLSPDYRRSSIRTPYAGHGGLSRRQSSSVASSNHRLVARQSWMIFC